MTYTAAEELAARPLTATPGREVTMKVAGEDAEVLAAAVRNQPSRLRAGASAATVVEKDLLHGQ